MKVIKDKNNAIEVGKKYKYICEKDGSFKTIFLLSHPFIASFNWYLKNIDFITFSINDKIEIASAKAKIDLKAGHIGISSKEAKENK
jgi:hypothetical protein